jgi:DNA-binding transcriptional MerR regulator
MPNEAAASITPKYLIGKVTKLTGLSIDVVRVWERRYGAVVPARSDGGTRLYSDADVQRLIRLRQAVEKGNSIGQAARLSETELDDLIIGPVISRVDVDPYQNVRDRFMDAVQSLDVVAADLELTRAVTLFPAPEFVKRIAAPILVEVGERRAHQQFGVALERVASGLLRNVLGSLLRLYRPSENARTLVLATPAEDRHELGPLLAAVLAATHDWRVIYLGADLPAAEIALVVRSTKAQVLSLSLTTDRRRADQELDALSRIVSPTVRVWIGGAQAIKHKELIDRANWVLIRDLDELDDRLKD